jgi:hypothetical protein
MAKRVDPLKAKQAKQKKIAIVLSLLLVLVIAYQGPKTLKMLKGPQPVAAPTATDPATTATTPETGAVPAPAVATPSDPTQPAVLADSDTPVGAGQGQLLSFEQFSSSDPFQQQVDMKAGAVVDPTAPDADSLPGTAPVSPGVDPAIPGSAENPPLSFGSDSAGSSGSSGSTSGSTGSTGSGSSGVVPGATAPAPAAATTISLNGVVQTIAMGTPFPLEDPTFQLVSLGADGKSVQIGVAGGSLAGGGAAVKLVIGKPLTLQNTVDGSLYKLVLLTVEGAPPPTG